MECVPAGEPGLLRDVAERSVVPQWCDRTTKLIGKDETLVSKIGTRCLAHLHLPLPLVLESIESHVRDVHGARSTAFGCLLCPCSPTISYGTRAPSVDDARSLRMTQRSSMTRSMSRSRRWPRGQAASPRYIEDQSGMHRSAAASQIWG